MDTLWKIRPLQGKKRELHVAVKNEKGNRIYDQVETKTRKSSSANSEIKQCLMRHSDWLRLALLDFRVTYKLIGHSVIKQCKTRKSTFYRESVP